MFEYCHAGKLCKQTHSVSMAASTSATWPPVRRRGALADHAAQAAGPRVGMQAEALVRAPRAPQLQLGLACTKYTLVTASRLRRKCRAARCSVSTTPCMPRAPWQPKQYMTPAGIPQRLSPVARHFGVTRSRSAMSSAVSFLAALHCCAASLSPVVASAAASSPFGCTCGAAQIWPQSQTLPGAR